MDAAPLLARIAELLEKYRLEAVLIGNAAAAIQGAPITTLDFDFMFRQTPANLKKLRAVARELDATLYRPYPLAPGVIRVQKRDYRLLMDFLTRAPGVRSFEGPAQAGNSRALRELPAPGGGSCGYHKEQEGRGTPER